MKSFTIDPRRHDGVVFVLDTPAVPGRPEPDDSVMESTLALAHRLRQAGVVTALYSPGGHSVRVLEAAGIAEPFTARVERAPTEAAELPTKRYCTGLLAAAVKLGVAAERSAVVAGDSGGVAAARECGFADVIGLDQDGHSDELLHCGADVVVANLSDVMVRTGDECMSRRPNALDSYGQVIGMVSGRQPVVCVNYDSTLSEIVPDPDLATLVDGAAEALADLAVQCPVAILSGRDLADLRDRIGLPGIWYAGSHGFELMAPDGTRYHHDAAAAAVAVLASAATELRDELGPTSGAHVEHTRFGVRVHYGKVAHERVPEVIAAVHRQSRRQGLRLTTGPGSVELHPDVDWDKGTALAWIRDHIVQSSGQSGVESGVGSGAQPGRLLPIYIGGDLTDEDAFDAVRFSGIGVVVRHDEDGDRPTAASFTLTSPTEARDFVRRGARWLAYDHETRARGWTFTWEGYDPPNEKLREALCTVGNGYFATRGAAPESKAGQVHYPGTYAAAVYNRLDDLVAGTRTAHESLVNLPNWLPLTFRVNDGDWLDLDAVTLLSYRQTLDLRGAVLTRELTYRDDVGRTTSITQHRFVAMNQAHVAALQTTIVAQDWEGTIEIRSTLDAGVRNSGVERYRDLASNHLQGLEKVALSENSVLLAVETTQSKIPVALAARTSVWHGDTPAPATYRLLDEEFEIGHQIFTDLKPGQPLTVEKIVTLVTGRDVATSHPSTGAERRLARQGRFAEICAAHRLAWAHLWERLSIEFSNHTEELRVLRLHLLHLLQTVSYNSEELDVGVPARGLHGEAYRGHIFWDELFIFPVLNLRVPTVTRSLLRYRHRRLVEARRAAKLAGYRGAMYPWQSGSDGREESPEQHLNPRSGRWRPDASHRAHHIGIAVAYNVWNFYQVTGDLAYMIDYGTEMMAEIARFWVSRATYDRDRDRYTINGVIGPDEFHSGYPDRPYDGVDNNAYTNVMAVWVILRAIDALQLMPLPNRLDLCEELGLTDEELAHWDHVSRRMFVPFHDGVISQFEGYEQLLELDWDAYRRRYRNIQRLDRILEAEDDDVNRYRASKQADALMLLYLLSADELRELLDRLDYHLDPRRIPEMVDYYLARTSHGSTLSAVVHGWVLARANRDRALEFFQQVLKSDIADIQGGTTSEGVHLAAMAGSVDFVQRCFTGLEIRGDRIVLSPLWPEYLGALGFPIHYRGNHLHLRVSGKGAEISVEPRDVPPVEVECRGRVERLIPGSVVRFT
ncbi:trehalose-phosphatase [Mycobacterium gastri]|uniref:Haloacid dehalogenase n=1 Tax=Mycobacterium gastri TaxID=1777 RepID=A0A1X1VA92_MYCGS|nr:trehalose-phosphatase [Mycobacterium gastri]ETW23625.1 haloacid dehalogenase [Mycobacterium gastri 'Wayne']ORV65878.1 haloacid dehalogenase [Mycobacterium gastri]